MLQPQKQLAEQSLDLDGAGLGLLAALREVRSVTSWTVIAWRTPGWSVNSIVVSE
jgi:hypothetical protein